MFAFCPTGCIINNINLAQGMEMNEKENIINYPNSIDTRVALLEQSINHINQSLIGINSNIKDINTEIKTHFRWTMGLIGGIYLTIFGSLLTVVIKFAH